MSKIQKNKLSSEKINTTFPDKSRPLNKREKVILQQELKRQ